MGKQGGNKEEGTEPERLPSPPQGVSRIDTLPDDFVGLLSRRPHMAGDVLASRYKLLESLGDGAMGQVFVAENLTIGRRVALKLLRPELLADISFRRRFQQEAMATAAIEHRNVARFIDVVIGDPTFLVMEYVSGPTLAKVLKSEGRLDWVRAVRLTVRLCWALEAAHQRGIVHRDVKPANVILSPDPEVGEEPKLIDFGLAKVPTIVGAENLTRTGQIIGTPHYMSPEQIANRDVDSRSDVYALGCLLYHQLAGGPPFAGAEDVQILYKQISDPPPPLLPKLRAPVPNGLVEIVDRALQKDPERRFRSMREMAKALAAVERRRDVTPDVDEDRAGAPERVATPTPGSSRRRLWPTLGAVVLATFATAGMIGRWTKPSAHTLLVVTSRPTGARVWLDGKLLAETTPTSVRGLSPGAHRLRLEQAGRDPVEQVVHVADGGRAEFDAALPPKSRQIPLTSIPSGAAVYLDGLRIPGETPTTLTVADDDFHELRVEKPGYEPEKTGLAPDQTSPLALTLLAEKEPRGYIWVDSNGVAEVLIDGKSTSYMTPTLGIAVKVGSHTVALRSGSGATGAPVTVTIGIGETQHLTLAAPDECGKAETP